MRFRLVISDPWELGPVSLIGDGVASDEGFVLQLDPGAQLGGIAVTRADVRLRHANTSFSQIAVGDYPSVNGAATGPDGEVRFVAHLEPA